MSKPVVPTGNNKRAKHARSVSAVVAKKTSALGLAKPEKEPPANKTALKALIMSAFADYAKSKVAPIVSAVVATTKDNK